jgi:ABC-type Fe3+-hydroxamate transport system substrate-binding protein
MPLEQIVTDQIGNTVELPATETLRIVSVVPSQTELLFHLGLNKEVAGITRFCVSPPQWQKEKAIIGGTKTLKIGMIENLKPNLIIANKEENVKEQIDTLGEKFPVWTSEVNNLADALQMIKAIGLITGKEFITRQMTDAIEMDFAALDHYINLHLLKPRRAAYFIWRNPYMVVGGDSFINDMVNRAGYQNVFADRERYPEVSAEEIKKADPKIILLSSEPYRFEEKHLDEFLELCPNADVKLVNGAMFSWYGSRLTQAPDYFRRLLT